jgi:plastocyanin
VRTERVPPGAEAALTVTLPAGVYRVDCFVEEAGVGEHDALGMRTQLVVRDDAPLVIVKPTAPAPAPTVSIQGFAFAPEVLQVSAGTTVVWTNNDPAPHTVTAEDRSFDSSLLMTNQTFQRGFDTPGTFLYQCSLHPTMKGRVEVKR